jgi:hypothetical protein
MKITPTDDTRRLFQVEDFVSPELLAELQQLDWTSIPWTRQPLQESWPRRLLDPTHPTLDKVVTCVNNAMKQLCEECRIEVKEFVNTSFWLDEPGFTVSLHTDGQLPGSMQLFWVMPTEQHGTVFYNSNRPEDVRFAPKGIPNTGYIMLNKLNEDGSQPLHWHGMLHPVPPGTIRVTSYTVIRDYENK